MNKSDIKVDARGGLGVPQEFAGMVGLAGGGHLYAANMPQQESKSHITNKSTFRAKFSFNRSMFFLIFSLSHRMVFVCA